MQNIRVCKTSNVKNIIKIKNIVLLQNEPGYVNVICPS